MNVGQAEKVDTNKKDVKRFKVVTREKIIKRPPYEVNVDFIVSKRETGSITKYPVFGDTAEQDLVRVITDLSKSEVNLKVRRSEAIGKRKSLDEQWQDLRVKELTLRENFLYFNKFVRENMEKRDRAAKKTGEDIVLKEQRTAAVEEIKSEMSYLQVVKKKMEFWLRKYSIYENFLITSIQESAAEFKTIDDILNKYETLLDAKQKLAITQEETLSKLESAKVDLLKFSAESELLIMGLNNRLADLETRYKNVNEGALSREHLVEKVKCRIIGLEQEVTCIKESAYNLYLSICERKKIKPIIPEQNIEQLLLYIKKSIELLLRADKLLRRHIKKTSLRRSSNKP